ncbi:hypothetical protein [Enteractinococcus coprophilus]|uniref:DNA modification methylase n=1 Tax=Enteractinococcus coprophilus TaxID=1027633 RepID=A0A543AFR2_9MICC|nr:hypothetical protein [Enteractinococcus coprophilus]TQL71421.1 hypothetical protein FB556_1901 [Enteractinococcus coprophilus]
MKVNKTRRNVFAGLALAAILGTTGCSAINPQATTFEYAPSDGTQTTVSADDTANSDTVDFLNIGVITNDANDSGRVMGTIHNKSSKRQSVELKINNNKAFEFSLDANEQLMLEEEDLILESVGTEPGGLADGVATAFGNSIEFNVSVLPPTLEEYRELYPGDLDEREQSEHLYDFQGQYHRDE